MAESAPREEPGTARMQGAMYPGEHAATMPDRAAAIRSDTGEALTYRDLDQRSNQLAQLLHARGLRRGDHMALFMENRLDYFVVMWAAIRSGLMMTRLPMPRRVSWRGTADTSRHSLLTARRSLRRQRVSCSIRPRSAVSTARVPASLRLFLLTVAIVDDLGAVAIIAVAYTRGIDGQWLGAMAVLLAALATCNRAGVRSGWVYAGLGVSILSTPRGVMSDAEARAANVGGEVLCRVF